MYLLRIQPRKTLAEIGQCFEIAVYSTVCSGIARTWKELRTDLVVRKIFGDIEHSQKSKQALTPFVHDVGDS